MDTHQTSATPDETKPLHELALEGLRRGSPEVAYDVMCDVSYSLGAHYLHLEREELAKPEPNPVLVFAYKAAFRIIQQQRKQIKWGDGEAVEKATREWGVLARYAHKDDPPLNEHDRSEEAQSLIDQGYTEEQAAYLLLAKGRTPELMDELYPGMREAVFPNGVTAL